MRRLSPYQFITKYGNNVYKVDLLIDHILSPIFNIIDLVSYKMKISYYIQNIPKTTQEIAELHLTLAPPLQETKVLDSRTYKKTRKKDYIEHLV